VKDYLERLFQHRGWANQRVLASLLDCPEAQTDGTPLLAHLLAAEHVWLSRLQGKEPLLAVWPSLSLSECQLLAAQCDLGWVEYLSGLTDAGLQAKVEFRNARGESYRDSFVDILSQVVTHGAHHRGQIAQIVSRAGGAAASTDYILFARSH
jgi:uncharacterized damage-inducible protein DinB